MEGLHRLLAPAPACSSLLPGGRKAGSNVTKGRRRGPPAAAAFLAFKLLRLMPPVIGVLHNLDRAFTGHAGTAIRAAGVELDERRLRAGEPLPSLDAVDGLLPLGGDQSVLDIRADLSRGGLTIRLGSVAHTLIDGHAVSSGPSPIASIPLVPPNT